MKSMTNNYVKTNNAKAHSTPHNELNHWFRIWGIIGERREPVTPVRTAPSVRLRRTLVNRSVVKGLKSR